MSLPSRARLGTRGRAGRGRGLASRPAARLDPRLTRFLHPSEETWGRMTAVCGGGVGTRPGPDRGLEHVSGKRGPCAPHAAAGSEISNRSRPRAPDHVARRGPGPRFITGSRRRPAHEGPEARVLGRPVDRRSSVPAHRGTARKVERVPPPRLPARRRGACARPPPRGEGDSPASEELASRSSARALSEPGLVVSVTAGFRDRLGQAAAPRGLVRHPSGCFCEGAS